MLLLLALSIIHTQMGLLAMEGYRGPTSIIAYYMYNTVILTFTIRQTHNYTCLRKPTRVKVIVIPVLTLIPCSFRDYP